MESCSTPTWLAAATSCAAEADEPISGRVGMESSTHDSAPGEPRVDEALTYSLTEGCLSAYGLIRLRFQSGGRQVRFCPSTRGDYEGLRSLLRNRA